MNPNISRDRFRHVFKNSNVNNKHHVAIINTAQHIIMYTNPLSEILEFPVTKFYKIDILIIIDIYV